MHLVQYISLFTMYVYSIYLFDKVLFTDSLSLNKNGANFLFGEKSSAIRLPEKKVTKGGSASEPKKIG